MRFSQINGPLSGDLAYAQRPETVDAMFQNVQGATITLGLPVSINTNPNSIDGFSAVLPQTNNVATFYGIALRTTPNNAAGMARIEGYCASVAIFATGTSVSISAGVAVGPGVAGSLGVNSTGLVHAFGPVITLDTVTAAINSPGGYIRALVRAM